MSVDQSKSEAADEVARLQEHIGGLESALDELQTRGRLLDSAIHHLPAIIFRIDEDGRCLDAAGAGLAALRVEDLEAAIRDRVLQEYPDLFARLKQNEQDQAICVTAHGYQEDRPWWLQICLLFDERRGEGAIGLAIDISQRKQAQMGLDHFFALSLDLFCIAGLDGYFKRINPAFEQVLGYPEEELLERPFIDFVHPDDRAATIRQVAALTDGEPATSFENRYRCKDGTYRWLEWTSRPMLQEGLMYAVARDVTQQKKAEATAHELRIARQIQQALLPKTTPTFAEYDVAAVSYPATEVGGDQFDFVDLGDGAMGILVADASGHGLGPAMLAAEVQACVRSLARLYAYPSHVLTEANDILAHGLPENCFVTALLAKLDPVRHTLFYASAGHTTAYLLDAQGQLKNRLLSTGLPLGIEREAAVPEGPPMQMDPGETLLLLTDGLEESLDQELNLFGSKRILEIVREHRRASAQAITAALYDQARQFLQNAPQRDDITIIVIKRLET